MKRATARFRIGRLGFYIAAAFLALVVWRSEVYMQTRVQVYGVSADSLSDLQQQQLQAFLDMNRLLTTLATTLLGAVGLLTFGGFKGHHCSRELWAAVAGGLCIGLSLYFGYHAYEDILFMLQNQTFDLTSAAIFLDCQAHFYAFLLGTIFFADFVYQNMRIGGDHEDSRDGATS